MRETCLRSYRHRSALCSALRREEPCALRVVPARPRAVPNRPRADARRVRTCAGTAPPCVVLSKSSGRTPSFAEFTLIFILMYAFCP